jgi:anti-sigma regulatory factor (Ser/Thr protein kinase)
MAGVLVEELFADARAENVRPLRRAVARIAVREGADREVISDAALCVEEALANVVRHAYAGRPGPLEVRVLRAPGEFEVLVRDMGNGLDSRHAGTLGIGLTLISRLCRHASIAAAPGGGAEVRMSFPLG